MAQYILVLLRLEIVGVGAVGQLLLDRTSGCQPATTPWPSLGRNGAGKFLGSFATSVL